MVKPATYKSTQKYDVSMTSPVAKNIYLFHWCNTHNSLENFMEIKTFSMEI